MASTFIALVGVVVSYRSQGHDCVVGTSRFIGKVSFFFSLAITFAIVLQALATVLVEPCVP
jgi:hypothetical protein